MVPLLELRIQKIPEDQKRHPVLVSLVDLLI